VNAKEGEKHVDSKEIVFGMEEDQQAGPCFNEPLLPISSSDRPAPSDHHRPACNEPSNIGAQWRAAALLLGKSHPNIGE
jgi:hypothetical protein